MPTHLSGLLLGSGLVSKVGDVSWQGATWRDINVHCHWDNVKLHDDSHPPLYIQYKDEKPLTELVQALITPVQKQTSKT